MRFWRKYRWLLLVLLVLAVLFISSAMTYKEQTIVPWLHRVLCSEPGRTWLSHIRINYGAGEIISVQTRGYDRFVEFLLRKAAHFGTYFLLGTGLYLWLKRYLHAAGVRALVTPLAVGGIAALDEFHQLLTGGRSPEVQDVILDMAGAAVAVLLLAVWDWQRRHHRQHSA